MSVLLVWNMIEDVRYYLLPKKILEEDDSIKVLDVANTHYINIDNEGEIDVALSIINNALSEEKSSCDPNVSEIWYSIWSKYKVDVRDLKDVHITHVFECGFYP
jgi:hypothetical protein